MRADVWHATHEPGRHRRGRVGVHAALRLLGAVGLGVGLGGVGLGGAGCVAPFDGGGERVVGGDGARGGQRYAAERDLAPA
eukprot:6196094-Pleurochrysis_carterae.AAC.1